MNLSSSKKTVIASVVAAVCMAAPALSYAANQNPDQPNVLLVVMDDLGTGQLNFALDSLDKSELGKRPVPVRYQGDLDKMIDAAQRAMPNVEKLATNGIKMTNAFVANFSTFGIARCAASIILSRSP